MSRADRRWLLQVWQDGDGVYIKADDTVDVGVAVAHACQVLEDTPGIPDQIRAAAAALGDALRGERKRTPMLYPKKGPPGSAA